MRFKNAEFLRHTNTEVKETIGEKITSTPPFLSYVEAAVWKAQNEAELQRVVQTSHTIDKDYFFWETHRKGLNPVGCFGTGYEAYFVARPDGSSLCPEEASEQIVAVGISILDGIRRTHKHSFSHRNALEKVIRGEASTSWAIEEWNAIFGASLARLRAEIAMNQRTLEYRSRVKEKVQPLPQIRYVVGSDGLIRQEYFIAAPKSTPLITTNEYHGDEEELALTIMQNIGKFGHPLLRTAMRYAHS